MILIKHGGKNLLKQKADEMMKEKYCPKYSKPLSLHPVCREVWRLQTTCDSPTTSLGFLVSCLLMIEETVSGRKERNRT